MADKKQPVYSWHILNQQIAERVEIMADSLNLQQYQACFDNSPCAFCILSPIKDDSGEITDLHFAYVNEAAARLVNCPLKKMQNGRYYSVFRTPIRSGCLFLWMRRKRRERRRWLNMTSRGISISRFVSIRRRPDTMPAAFRK